MISVVTRGRQWPIISFATWRREWTVAFGTTVTPSLNATLATAFRSAAFGAAPVVGTTSVVKTASVTRTTGLAVAFQARRTQLVHRQFAITVPVEFLQRFAGVLDLRLVNHPVMVRVQCGEEWRRRRALAICTGTTWTAGTIRSARTFAMWRTLTSWRRAVSILCCHHPR